MQTEKITFKSYLLNEAGVTKYYVASIYDNDDIMLLSDDGEKFVYHAGKFGKKPKYNYTKKELTGLRIATVKDFDLFDMAVPSILKKHLS